MLSDERAALADGLDVAVGQEISVRELAPASTAEDECRADPAVDITGPVAPSRTGRQRKLVVRILVGVEIRGQLLQGCGALLEREATQRGAADMPRVVNHRSRVDAGGRHPRDRVTRC